MRQLAIPAALWCSGPLCMAYVCAIALLLSWAYVCALIWMASVYMPQKASTCINSSSNGALLARGHLSSPFSQRNSPPPPPKGQIRLLLVASCRAVLPCCFLMSLLILTRSVWWQVPDYETISSACDSGIGSKPISQCLDSPCAPLSRALALSSALLLVTSL